MTSRPSFLAGESDLKKPELYYSLFNGRNLRPFEEMQTGYLVEYTRLVDYIHHVGVLPRH